MNIIEGINTPKPEARQMSLEMFPDKTVRIWIKELINLSLKKQLEHLRVEKTQFVPLRHCNAMALYRQKTNDWKIKISSTISKPVLPFFPSDFGHELGHILLARDENLVNLPPKSDSSSPDAWKQANTRRIAEDNICYKFGEAWSGIEKNRSECFQLLHELSQRKGLQK